MLNTEKIVDKVIEALEDRKAHRIVKIDLRKIENCFCNFFVICNGTSGTHITGLTDMVEEKVRKDLKETPYHCEGLNTSQWVVMDYGDVIVHIFDEELRDYYKLEEFWGDGIVEVMPQCEE
ncbi:MAG: ribosome silencing factor [Odoribacter sp.]